MIYRVNQENQEHRMLSPLAAKAGESRGRIYREAPCDLRTDFQRDRDRILHSKAFRRLMHKTQVFLALEGDHFRTRLTHTLEVAQIARTIARAMALNEDLTEAIALGHDLGHTPFGHNGEMVLDRIHPGGFRHNVQSLRVVDILEDSHGRKGINLTQEVRDGILNHTGKGIPFTLEGQVVKISDRIAYINHDIDDALRSGIIGEEDLPKEAVEYLGASHRSRIDTLVKDMINTSWNRDIISMSEEGARYMDVLRTFMFQKVYCNKNVKRASDIKTVEIIIGTLYDYFQRNPEGLPKEYEEPAGGDRREIIKDYIAGMTDRYAMNLYNELFLSRS